MATKKTAKPKKQTAPKISRAEAERWSNTDGIVFNKKSDKPKKK